MLLGRFYCHRVVRYTARCTKNILSHPDKIPNSTIHRMSFLSNWCHSGGVKINTAYELAFLASP